MHRRDKLVLWTAIILIIGGTGYALSRMGSVGNLTGTVLRDDPRLGNQLTLANVQITGDDLEGGAAKSDASGYFKLKLRHAIRKGDSLSLHFRHPDYRPLDTTLQLADDLYVIRMRPVSTAPVPSGTSIAIGDVRLRYTVKSRTTQNVGSVAKAFEVNNTGNVPCASHDVCSPDGKWKASIGGTSLDAGDDSEFQDARVSCIAGPCPFSAIEKDSFSRGGKTISVSVRDWSDPVSYVLEAAVMRTATSGSIVHSYPVIYNQTATFTLPMDAEGPSIEATVDRQEIVYPLGPSAKLSWADCDIQTSQHSTKLYRCSLKAGFTFR